MDCSFSLLSMNLANFDYRVHYSRLCLPLSSNDLSFRGPGTAPNAMCMYVQIPPRCRLYGDGERKNIGRSLTEGGTTYSFADLLIYIDLVR